MSDEIPTYWGLYLLAAAFAGNEPDASFLEVRPLQPTGSQVFLPVRRLKEVVEVVEVLRERHDLVGIGVTPRVRRSGGADAVERAWTLAADLDSGDAAERLCSFRPLPSIVARSKTPGHLHAYWPISSAVPAKVARRASLRLAHALDSDKAVCDPARVMRAPREFLRVELDVFRLDNVVGHLPDDPRHIEAANGRRRADRPETAASPSALLDGILRVVHEAVDGERNNRLNWGAFAAGQHVADGILDADEAREELLRAAVDVGLPRTRPGRRSPRGCGGRFAMSDDPYRFTAEEEAQWFPAVNGNGAAPTTEEMTVVAVEDFAAIEEPGVDPIVGEREEVLIPAGGDVMVYGNGGAGKTTLTLDLACHIATPRDWLGFKVGAAVRVLVIENEGPRPLMRRKLARKLAAWDGDLGGRVRIVESPWARFTFATAEWRAALVEAIRAGKIDVLIAGPLTQMGWTRPGRSKRSVRSWASSQKSGRRSVGRR